MEVREILLRRTFLVKKLEEVDKVLSNINNLELDNKQSIYTKLINIKFELLSKIRSHTILLDNLNNETIINIDGTEISVYEALHLLDTLEHKINTFSSIILNDSSKTFDVFDIFNKKDVLLDEYINIYLAVLRSDLKTVWEG